MPFTKENKPLLLDASFMNFQFMKDGRINYRKHSTKELCLYFIKRAIEIHGNKYGYSKVTYVNNSTKVILQCKEHGDFEQTPRAHMGGKGCHKCGGSYKLSLEDFVLKARAVHGDRYNYDLVQYKNHAEKIEIMCPEHGSFFPTPNNHLRGSGCPKCAGNGISNTQEFIQKARVVHGDRYSYDFVEYKNSKDKVEIICQEHGSFLQAPDHHLNGSGCTKCSGTYSPTTEEFIQKATIVHGDKYDYSKVTYKSAKEKIEIVCPLHGSFFQAPHKHLGFRGCPKCAGHNHNILYLLKCLDTGWYKIGITTNNTEKRIRDIGGHIEEVHHVKLEDPRKHETILHKRYEKDREYNLFVSSGPTEFFSLTEEKVQEVIAYMDEVSNER